MSDLISRQALHERINETVNEGLIFSGMTIAEFIEALIDAAPSAESEVIRCKDCKYHVGEGCCDYWDEGRMFLDISDSDYCSKAERREEE